MVDGSTYIVPVIVGKLLASVSPLDAGAVDQNINLVASGGDFLGDVCDLLLHGKVSCEYPCLAASLFDGLFCRRRRGVSLCQLC